jgi:hypothetical protein
MTAFWDIALCSFVEVEQRFTSLMMMTVYISETSVYFIKTTRRQAPEICHLHTRRHENLKPHTKR